MSHTKTRTKQPTAPATKNPHQWRKGQSGNPNGRPKGQLNKIHELQQRAAASGATPLDILLAIARKDPDDLARMGIAPKEVSIHMRMRCAEAALPYLHRRMPVAVQAEVYGGMTISSTALSQLSDTTLDHLLSEMQNVGLIPHLPNLIEGDQTK
jgi:hypothetical protein